MYQQRLREILADLEDINWRIQESAIDPLNLSGTKLELSSLDEFDEVCNEACSLVERLIDMLGD